MPSLLFSEKEKMEVINLLQNHLIEECPFIHGKRLQALMDVACGLQKKQTLTLTAMGRGLTNTSQIKNKIKKVDRLESNKHLHDELFSLYMGLSNFVFRYLSYQAQKVVIIDLCYLKDDHDIQMLSAEIAAKGRSLPLYREVFGSGELKGRANQFLSSVKACIPSDIPVILIMDAGFGVEWFQAIEANGWHWIARVRDGKKLKIEEKSDWQTVKEFIPEIASKAKSYNNAFLTKEYEHSCRIITSPKKLGGRKKSSRPSKNDRAGRDGCRRSAKEPWILATNLSSEQYSTTQIILYYSKRMQIEESFRDLKSHQFGLSARYIRTRCLYRWGVKMLLAAIVQIMFWVIGVIGHSQGFQRVFQANTVKDKKVFSYFYLGQLIIEYDKLHELVIDYDALPITIEQELSRKW